MFPEQYKITFLVLIMNCIVIKLATFDFLVCNSLLVGFYNSPIETQSINQSLNHSTHIQNKIVQSNQNDRIDFSNLSCNSARPPSKVSTDILIPVFPKGHSITYLMNSHDVDSCWTPVILVEAALETPVLGIELRKMGIRCDGDTGGVEHVELLLRIEAVVVVVGDVG